MRGFLNTMNRENGSNYKMQVLQNTDTALVKKLLGMTYDKVRYNYGITMKNIEYTPEAQRSELLVTLEMALVILEEKFCSREVTGNKAKEVLTDMLESLTEDDAYVLAKVIDRDLRVNIGRSNINKVFKNLIVKPPYMRCGIYSTKTAKKITFPALLQLKADGRYVSISVDGGVAIFTSRSGEESSFPSLLESFKNAPDGVYIGELLVDGLTNRSEANGLLNSDTVPEGLFVQLWDFISHTEWGNGKGKNTTTYEVRFDKLQKIMGLIKNDRIRLIPSFIVDNIQEALKYTSEFMADGFEGGILKDLNNVFKDHTSPTQLKLKLEIDLEVRCTGFTEGKAGTKRVETFGAMTFANDENTIIGQCSGFSDKQLADFNSRREELIGLVFTVQFNDLSKARNNEHYALSHPRFIGFRDDKDETDTLEKAFELRTMAMQLK